MNALRKWFRSLVFANIFYGGGFSPGGADAGAACSRESMHAEQEGDLYVRVLF